MAAPNFDLQALLADPPKLHFDGEQLTSRWRIDDTTAIAIHNRAKPGMKTLETGAGLSTIIFAAHGCDHTCITPDPALVERIQSYCRTAAIDTSTVTFHIAKSTDAVHQMSSTPYDLILIDGCHGFPTMFVDFYYAAKALRTGGELIIDDLHIFTCELVARFMESDPGWQLNLKTDRIAVGTKISDTADREWCDQKNIQKWSRPLPFPWRTWYYLLNVSKPLRHRYGLNRK